MRTDKLAVGLLLLALAPSPAVYAQAPERTVAVGGDVVTPLVITVDALKTLPRTTVEVQKDGRTLTYEGVLVGELLKRAGAPLGAQLRGVPWRATSWRARPMATVRSSRWRKSTPT